MPSPVPPLPWPTNPLILSSCAAAWACRAARGLGGPGGLGRPLGMARRPGAPRGPSQEGAVREGGGDRGSGALGEVGWPGRRALPVAYWITLGVGEWGRSQNPTKSPQNHCISGLEPVPLLNHSAL